MPPLKWSAKSRFRASRRRPPAPDHSFSTAVDCGSFHHGDVTVKGLQPDGFHGDEDPFAQWEWVAGLLAPNRAEHPPQPDMESGPQLRHSDGKVCFPLVPAQQDGGNAARFDSIAAERHRLYRYVLQLTNCLAQVRQSVHVVCLRRSTAFEIDGYILGRRFEPVQGVA